MVIFKSYLTWEVLCSIASQFLAFPQSQNNFEHLKNVYATNNWKFILVLPNLYDMVLSAEVLENVDQPRSTFLWHKSKYFICIEFTIVHSFEILKQATRHLGTFSIYRVLFPIWHNNNLSMGSNSFVYPSSLAMMFTHTIICLIHPFSDHYNI